MMPEQISSAADRLPLNAVADEQTAEASCTAARNATDKADLTALLAALGLPAHEGRIVALLPLIPDPTAHLDTEPATAG